MPVLERMDSKVLEFAPICELSTQLLEFRMALTTCSTTSTSLEISLSGKLQQQLIAHDDGVCSHSRPSPRMKWKLLTEQPMQIQLQGMIKNSALRTVTIHLR